MSSLYLFFDPGGGGVGWRRATISVIMAARNEMKHVNRRVVSSQRQRQRERGAGPSNKVRYPILGASAAGIVEYFCARAIVS